MPTLGDRRASVREPAASVRGPAIDRLVAMILRHVAILVGATALAVCALLYAFAPAVPHSVLGWAALAGLGIPAWLFLEWLGGAVLGSGFLTRRSSGMRILLGVPAVLVLAAIGWLCVWLVQAAVASAP